MNHPSQFITDSRASILCRLGLLLFSANLGATSSSLKGNLQLTFDTPQAAFVADSTDFIHQGQLRNSSNTTIQAPISLVLTGLTPNDTTLGLQPVDGINADGNPYAVLLDSGEFKPDQAMPVAIRFTFQNPLSRLGAASLERLATTAFPNTYPRDTPAAFTYHYDLRRLPAGNHTPTAKAMITWANARITLDASQSSDTDQQRLSYQWTLIEKPSGSRAEIPSPTARQTQFAPDVAGTYGVKLIVDDGFETSLPDTATVTITREGNGVENHLPVIFSAPNTGATGTRLYTYPVKASDSDGDKLIYALADAPSDMTIDPNSGVISWQAPQPHHDGMQYRVVVSVKDDKGGEASQSFEISVKLCTCL